MGEHGVAFVSSDASIWYGLADLKNAFMLRAANTLLWCLA